MTNVSILPGRAGEIVVPFNYRHVVGRGAVDPGTVIRARHHIDQSLVQRAVKEAVAAAGVQNEPGATRSAIPLQPI